MGIWGIVKGAVGGLLKPVTSMVDGWQKRKSAKLESQLKIQEAKTQAQISKIERGQTADIAWEQTSIDKAGWKDEWFTLLLSIPAILCFCGPTASAWVTRGFEALRETPEWYQWAFMVAVGSAFGYRKIADFMSLRKGE